MAVVMSMHWPEATLEQYEQARQQVGWERQVPQGALFHIAWLGDDGFRVLDLWSSPADFQRFLETRLTPAIQRIGIQGQPDVRISPAHSIFNPNVPQAGRKAPAAGRRPAARRAAPTARAKAKSKKGASKSKSKRAAKSSGKRKSRR